MKSPPSTGRWIVRVVGLALVGLFLGLMARFCHPVYGFTALLQLDPAHAAGEIAAFREYPVFVYDTPDSYDGLQYAQIAYHPLLTADELRPAVDNLAYRARRILLPAVAWLLAAGRPAAIANVYASLNLACWFVLAALLWRMLPVNAARGLVAWAGILFSAGVLGSVRFALTDLPAVTLIVAALWAAERARPRTALGWLAAAALTRETALVAWPGLCDGPWKSSRAIARNLLRGVLAAAPLVAWLAYVRWRVGPVSEGWSNFTWPGAGLLAKWVESLGEVTLGRDLPYSWGTLLAVAGLTAQFVYVFARPRPGDRWWRAGAAHALLMLLLGPAVWAGFPLAAARVLLPLNLACNVLALRTRAPLIWLLACNLTVFSGLMAVREVPRNSQEIATFRHGATAGVVRLGAGWYDREQNPGHRWAWAEASGRLMIATWPRSADIGARLAFGMRGLTPRTVQVRADGREIWRGPIGTNLSVVGLPLLRVKGGRTELELITDAPPVKEGSGPCPRLLGFELYDPVLSLSEGVPLNP